MLIHAQPSIAKGCWVNKMGGRCYLRYSELFEARVQNNNKYNNLSSSFQSLDIMHYSRLFNSLTLKPTLLPTEFGHVRNVLNFHSSKLEQLRNMSSVANDYCFKTLGAVFVIQNKM